MNFRFSNSILETRLLLHDPFADRNTTTISQGPLIYRTQDVDNKWADDYFNSVRISRNARFRVNTRYDSNEDRYTIVTAPGAKIDLAKYERLHGPPPGYTIDNGLTK